MSAYSILPLMARQGSDRSKFTSYKKLVKRVKRHPPKKKVELGENHEDTANRLRNPRKKEQDHSIKFLQLSNSHMDRGHMDVHKYSHLSLQATKLSLLRNAANNCPI